MDIIAGLQNRNNSEAYQLLQFLEKKSQESDDLYANFEDFLELLDSGSSFVRVRGFRLACAQAPWDAGGKLDANLDRLLALLDDEKPIAVRQYLSALHEVARCKPHLREKIIEKLDVLDLIRYGESMRPLIEQDAAALRKWA